MWTDWGVLKVQDSDEILKSQLLLKFQIKCILCLILAFLKHSLYLNEANT